MPNTLYSPCATFHKWAVEKAEQLRADSRLHSIESDPDSDIPFCVITREHLSVNVRCPYCEHIVSLRPRSNEDA